MYIKRILVAVVILGLVGMGIFSYFIYNTLLAPNTAFEASHAYVYIKTNATYHDVENELDPLLKHPDKFDIVARKKNYVHNVKAGRYRLAKGMSNNDIINVLRSQNKPLSLVFNNQDRLSGLAHRISSQIEADSAALMTVMQDTAFLRKHKFSSANALAMYIPNKYQFYWNTSAKTFRKRMLKEYKRFWNKERRQRAKEINLSPNEVQTLAAIVQKETKQPEEKRRVAGVYMNRLNHHIKLDADPTVIYAIKKNTNDFDTVIKRVLYEDLDTASPYNTYLNQGLPPGPIGMPDISTIDAVLNYERHKFYYFVADPERPGFHKFSKSLSQHNRNKRAYVRWLKKLDIYR